MLAVLVSHHGLDAWPRIASLLPGRNVRQCRDRWNHYVAERAVKDPERLDEDLLAWRMDPENFECARRTKWSEDERPWQLPFSSAADRASCLPFAESTRMVEPRDTGHCSKFAIVRDTNTDGVIRGKNESFWFQVEESTPSDQFY